MFDLVDDPEEKRELSKPKPELYKSMVHMLEEMHASVIVPGRRVPPRS
jgi:hypothetical protein